MGSRTGFVEESVAEWRGTKTDKTGGRGPNKVIIAGTPGVVMADDLLFWRTLLGTIGGRGGGRGC